MTPVAKPPPAPRSRTLQLWLIIGTLVALLAFLPALMMGGLSVMASDAGVNAMIYAFIYTMLSFPIALILCPILAWTAYGFRRERLAWVLLFLPFAWVVAAIALMVIGLGEPRPH